MIVSVLQIILFNVTVNGKIDKKFKPFFKNTFLNRSQQETENDVWKRTEQQKEEKLKLINFTIPQGCRSSIIPWYAQFH